MGLMLVIFHFFKFTSSYFIADQLLLYDPLAGLETSLTQVSDDDNFVENGALETISHLDTSHQRRTSFI
jgi:hypothetical protein